MKYAVLNCLAGALAIAIGAVGGFLQNPWQFLMCWPGLNFLLLGIAHAAHAPGIFGKRRDGSLPWWSWVLFFPLYLLAHLCWQLLRLLSREPPWAQVNESLLVGRRLLAGELPRPDLTVLDLTAEFAEPAGIVRSSDYHCFPVLDAAAPGAASLRECLLALPPDDKPLYIHCAQGHGRTGMAAAAWLVLHGFAPDAERALKQLKSVRPGIGLQRTQRRLVDEVLAPEAAKPAARGG